MALQFRQRLLHEQRGGAETDRSDLQPQPNKNTQTPERNTSKKQDFCVLWQQTVYITLSDV